METVADSTRAVQGAQALHHETAQALALESDGTEAEPMAKAQEGLEGIDVSELGERRWCVYCSVG